MTDLGIWRMTAPRAIADTFKRLGPETTWYQVFEAVYEVMDLKPVEVREAVPAHMRDTAVILLAQVFLDGLKALAEYRANPLPRGAVVH